MDNICVIIPTYNNAATLGDVLQRTHRLTADIIVVNDGSTDRTEEVLRGLPFRVEQVSYQPNRGKGEALKRGFKKALELGYDYAVTMDSDGQHFPEDLPRLWEAHAQHPEALLVGIRRPTAESTYRRNTFANRFSNFWFSVQTLRHLDDTQSGFRLYPLHRVSRHWIVSSRYEAELELLVMAAWMDVELRPVDVRVYYPPQEERVTHFRPAVDFTRISLLNTLLCMAALVFYLPKLLLYNLPRALWRRLFKA